MLTAQPACASRHAMPRPMTPAPIITVFGFAVDTIGVAITDSLHRASPARFSGFDLSRPCRTAAPGRHPSLLGQFRADAGGDARVFFCRVGPAKTQEIGDPVKDSVIFVPHPTLTRLREARCPSGHPPLKPPGRLWAASFFAPSLPPAGLATGLTAPGGGPITDCQRSRRSRWTRSFRTPRRRSPTFCMTA